MTGKLAICTLAQELNKLPLLPKENTKGTGAKISTKRQLIKNQKP
jgi:hypothetical protein